MLRASNPSRPVSAKKGGGGGDARGSSRSGDGWVQVSQGFRVGSGRGTMGFKRVVIAAVANICTTKTEQNEAAAAHVHHKRPKPAHSSINGEEGDARGSSRGGD